MKPSKVLTLSMGLTAYLWYDPNGTTCLLKDKYIKSTHKHRIFFFFVIAKAREKLFGFINNSKGGLYVPSLLYNFLLFSIALSYIHIKRDIKWHLINHISHQSDGAIYSECIFL
jgi:membrane-associated PAP2 superfamily phosphatase